MAGRQTGGGAARPAALSPVGPRPGAHGASGELPAFSGTAGT